MRDKNIILWAWKEKRRSLMKMLSGRYGLHVIKLILSIVLYVFAMGESFAATITWDGGGSDNNWSTCANWDNADTCPGPADIATFNATSIKDVTIDNDPNVSGIDIQIGYTGTITQSLGVTITVGSAGYVQNDGVFTGSNADIILNGPLTLNGGDFYSSSGSLNIAGDVYFNAGSFFHNSGTITYVGAVSTDIDIVAATQFNDVVVNKTNNLTLTGVMDINGNLSIVQAVNMNAVSDDKIALAGNLISSDIDVGGSLQIEFDGILDQSINTGLNDIPDGLIIVNKTNGELRLLADLDLSTNGDTAQDVLISQGTFDVNGFDFTVPDILTVEAAGNFQLLGDEAISYATLTLNSDSTVTYDGGGSYAGLIMGDTYSNLTFNGSGAWTLDNTLNVNSNLTALDGTLDTSNIGNHAINVSNNFIQTGGQVQANTSLLTVGGDFTANGTLTSTGYNNASLTLTGTGTLSYSSLSNPWSNGFNNLTVGLGGNTTTLSHNQALGVRNLLVVGSGSLTQDVSAIYLLAANSLSFDVNTTLDVGELRFSGVNQNIPPLNNGYDTNLRTTGTNTAVTQTGHVTLNAGHRILIDGLNTSSRVNSWTTAGFDLVVGGDVVIGHTTNTGTKTLDATGSTVTVTGNFTLQPGTTQFISAGSTVNFNGTNAQAVTLNGNEFDNVSITNNDDVVTFTDSLSTVNFTAITPDSQLVFTGGTTNAISGLLDLNGQASTTRIKLSSSNTTPYILNVTGGVQAVSYVDVEFADAGSNDIVADFSFNRGNNDDLDSSPHWVFNLIPRFK